MAVNITRESQKTIKVLELLEEMPRLFCYRGEPPSCPIDGKKCGRSLPCIVEYRDKTAYPHWICSRFDYGLLKMLRKWKRRTVSSVFWKIFYGIRFFLFPRKKLAWETKA